jgi:hypothetical protein
MIIIRLLRVLFMRLCISFFSFILYCRCAPLLLVIADPFYEDDPV